jgi:hypothetical protein
LSSACWEKEKKKKKEREREREREASGGFFPGPEAEHGLLAVPGRIFMAVRYN